MSARTDATGSLHGRLTFVNSAQSTHVAVDLGGIFANAQFSLTRPRLGARSEPQTEAAVAAEVDRHRLAVAAPNGAPDPRDRTTLCVGNPHGLRTRPSVAIRMGRT